MKKMVLTIITLVSLLLISSCKLPDNSISKPELIPGDIPTYNSSLIDVGFIQTGKESDWRDANTNDFMDSFTSENGYNFIYIDGNSRAERQVKAMYDLIRQKVDYIIIDPIIEDGWDEALKEAYEEKIPVIVTDRRVNADSSLYTCWIGSDFKEEGIKAGKWLEDYLKETGRLDEEINIVILEGTKGSSAMIGRTEGLQEEIGKHTNWHIIANECANFTQGEGQSVMNDILERYSDIDVLIAQNDNMMFGAMKAMDLKGVSYGVNGDIVTISFDALYEAFEKMIDGKLHVSVECNPLLAGLTNEIIMKLEMGHEVDKVNYSDEDVFTYKNAAYYLNDRKY